MALEVGIPRRELVDLPLLRTRSFRSWYPGNGFSFRLLVVVLQRLRKIQLTDATLRITLNGPIQLGRRLLTVNIKKASLSAILDYDNDL